MRAVSLLQYLNSIPSVPRADELLRHLIGQGVDMTRQCLSWLS